MVKPAIDQAWVANLRYDLVKMVKEIVRSFNKILSKDESFAIEKDYPLGAFLVESDRKSSFGFSLNPVPVRTTDAQATTFFVEMLYRLKGKQSKVILGKLNVPYTKEDLETIKIEAITLIKRDLELE